MDQLIASYERTIREVGLFSLKALMWLNGIALFCAWSPVVRPMGVWALTAPYFLAGIIAAFASLLVTYVAAEVAIWSRLSDRVLAPWWFVFMLATPAVSLFCFWWGVRLAISLMVGV